MDFTVICPNCGEKLRLFDSQIKKRKGTARCTRCGCRIPYDLSSPRPARTGYWAETETPFKPGAKEKLLSIAKARQKHPDARPTPSADALPNGQPAGFSSPVPPAFERNPSQFKKFDLKTGRVMENEAPAARPPLPAEKRKEPAKPLSAPRALPKASARAAGHARVPRPPVRDTFRAAPAARPLRAPGVLVRLHSFFSRLFHRG